MENNKRFWKKRGTFNSFLKKLIIDELEITDTKTAAKTFNNLFVKIGPNLLFVKQFGFRKGHSTEHPLI